MLDRLTLDQLRALVASADEGSFSAAGRKLLRAQSAVSQSVQTLEDELEIELFDRSGKFPVLSDAGKALIDDARIILEGAEALRARAATFASDIEPELTLAVEQMFPNKYLMDSLRVLGELFPAVRVTIYAEALGSPEKRLEAGAAQLGIYPPYNVGRGEFESEFLAAIPIVPVVCAQHPLALVDGPISNAQLNQHLQLVLTDPEQRMQTVAPGAPLGARYWQFADQRTRLEYLLGGFGWCHVPLHFVEDYLESGRLKRIALQRLAGGHLSIGLHVVHRRNYRLGKVARWLIDDLRERLDVRPAIPMDELGTAIPVGMAPRGAAG
ncbi:LysR family transcriptional regulator [Paraburkholderia fynbosensis]|uniref:HTH-type transcriptional regulator YhaJ n=1 Tax=Paraburkholderia fynbosensis TaxID=1200993 RepID=A0A6J5GVE5_9BURK|nr:LysR family transcriptional regulator [Paraburkholderia fynbosensis]CAB3806982.1 HTH-type transcriptional regulator YhaJ [Paraburkholderia fynbosensis]